MKHFTLSERFAAGRETRMSRRCVVMCMQGMLRLLRFGASTFLPTVRHNPPLQHG